MTITAELCNSSQKARKAMIDSQLRVSGVNAEWVLARMAAVAREDFVPAQAKAHAYLDRAIPLGGGRQLAAPLVHGLMLQEAAPSDKDDVLLVDGGSGYLAELVRPLVKKVEVISPEEAAGISGKGGGFSLLLVDGAIEQMPDSLAGQVEEGGRVVTGLCVRGVTRLAAGRQFSGKLALLPLLEIGIPVLPQFAALPGWSF